MITCNVIINKVTKETALKLVSNCFDEVVRNTEWSLYAWHKQDAFTLN